MTMNVVGPRGARSRGSSSAPRSGSSERAIRPWCRPAVYPERRVRTRVFHGHRRPSTGAGTRWGARATVRWDLRRAKHASTVSMDTRHGASHGGGRAHLARGSEGEAAGRRPGGARGARGVEPAAPRVGRRRAREGGGPPWGRARRRGGRGERGRRGGGGWGRTRGET